MLEKRFQSIKKDTLPPPAPIRNITAVVADTGNSYSIEGDGAYFAKLTYLGKTFDERLKLDVEQYVRHFTGQNCVCLSMHYRGINPAEYLQGLQYLYNPYFKYAVFFNWSLLQTAQDVMKEEFIIYYPASMTEGYLLYGAEIQGRLNVYSVLGGKAKRAEEPVTSMRASAQFIGLVQHKDGTLEYLYAYEINTQ